MRGILLSILAVITLAAAPVILQQDTQQLVQDCASKAGEGTIYLKDFVVSLPAAEPGQNPPVYRQAILLRGDNIYRFNICNQKGEAVIRIYDTSRMLVSSFDQQSGKEYNPINFACGKTGQYSIVITFKDGKAGDAIGIMSHVTKK